MRQVFALELPYVRAIASLADVEHGLLRDIVHEPDAARAEDAAVGDVDDVAAEVLHRVEPLRLFIPRVLASFLERVILQLALTGLITDRAIERVVDEQHLEHALAR